ncbi:MAG: response regulator [Deltaproteobacteria bacterium]|nr:response regulator [Deltaproteobacteria bacterium]
MPVGTKIVVLDDNLRFLTASKRSLVSYGFINVVLAETAAKAEPHIGPGVPDLLFVDIHLGGREDGLEFLRKARARGFDRLAAVISGDSSPSEFFRAAMGGANDFLVKGTRLDLGKEALRILSRGELDAGGEFRPENVADLGYLRTIGLTERDIEILTEFAVDFPRYKDLAHRMQQTEGHIRKTFSRICTTLGIENLPQLTHILTVCGMYARWSALSAEPETSGGKEKEES